MVDDLEITGATTGDISYVVAYYDVTTNNLYNANGQLYGNSTFATTLGNEFILELHYVQDISTSENPEEWVVWDGLKDMTVTSTLAFDDNYVHAVEATVAENTSAGSSKVKINVPEINKDVLRSSGNLVFNPFGIEPENAIVGETRPIKRIVSYSSFTYISGDEFEFTIDDAQGLPLDVVAGDNPTPVRVSEPLYLFVGTDSIYENNIPDRYSEGVFKIPMSINSRKLIKALDYSGASGVSGTMEHNIYVKREVLSGISTGGNVDNEHCVRYSKEDAVAVSGGSSSLFCAWIDFNDVSQENPTVVCWTKGIKVGETETIYNVSGGTAVVLSGSWANPIYATDSVLFRTFAFPFIVKNLVDYGNSITIPVENTDWTKEYIISIVQNNSEIVVGKASKGNYGVVLIGDNIDVDANGLISVPIASGTSCGVVETREELEDIEGGTNYVPTVKAVYDALALKQDNLDAGIATVEEIVKGSSGVNLVDSENLTGSLSVAKAVDVTSEPNANIGTLTYTDLRGEINYTGANGSAKIGFYDGATFPKFGTDAQNNPLMYMLIADVTNNSTVSVSGITFGGTSLNDFDGTLGVTGSTNATKRIAFKFNANNTGYIGFTATTTTNLTFTNLREFEVNGCSEDARKYIGQLENPDKHKDFYLVDYDEVNPWTAYIDMKTSPAVTLMSGLAYKMNAKEGTHTLTTDVCPAGYYGEDAHLKLFVGDTANIVFKSPLNLIDPLTPNAGHNITIKYRDGQANAYVDDTDIGYVVSVTAGTENGSLYYGLTTSDSEYIVFANTIAGSTVTLPSATTVSKVYTIVGNGTDVTYLSFPSIRCSHSCSFTNLTMTGGTIGVFLRADTTNSFSMADCNITGCTGGNGIWISAASACSIYNCIISGNSYGAMSYQLYSSFGGSIQNCTFEDNISNWDIQAYKGTSSISGCIFKDPFVAIRTTVDNGTSAYIKLSNNIFTNTGTNIQINHADAAVEFSDINELHGVVVGRNNTAGTVYFANGSTITGGTFTGVTLKQNNASDSYRLSGVKITGVTTTIPAINNVDLIDTVITNVTTSNYLMQYTDGESHVITGSTINPPGNAIQLTNCSNLLIENSTITKNIYISTNNQQDSVTTLGNGTDIKILQAGSVFRTGTVHILSGSTIKVTYIDASGSSASTVGILDVGTYIDGVWTPSTTSDGSATVILSGSTIHVYGIGTYINANGTTDLQTV